MIALFLLLVITAIVLGIVGIVAKGSVFRRPLLVACRLVCAAGSMRAGLAGTAGKYSNRHGFRGTGADALGR
jgi:hypothetical protein